MAPTELSMVAVDEDRAATREFASLDEQVLTVAGIYGPNASGKSNVLESLTWLSWAVLTSLRMWERTVPREPFKFGDGPGSSSTYDVEFMVGGVRYSYALQVDDSSIQFEGLYSYPERRRRTLFEREQMEISFRRGFGRAAAIRELLTPTTLALSAAMRFDEPGIGEFARALAGIDSLGSPRQHSRGWSRPRPRSSIWSTARMFAPDGPTPEQPVMSELPDQGVPDDRATALALLRFADLGIDDVEVVEELVNAPTRGERGGPPEARKRLRFLHRTADQRISFDLSDESEGTLTWFRLIGPMLRALRRGQILLFDEIESSLHPRLSARMIEIFQDPELNPRDAQLIFTSHDTSLLNHLNRDEVWLTEKGADGATTLTALAEYGGERVRRSLNLEKAYLQGRFGAVPELDQFVLRRALGLGGTTADGS